MSFWLIKLLTPFYLVVANECAPGCNSTMFSDDICQSLCNNFECDYDNNSCLCSTGCKPEYIMDNTSCHPECNNPNCNFQNFVCGTCASDCYSNMTGNGICDKNCNNSACGYDKGDCSCASGCQSFYNHSSEM